MAIESLLPVLIRAALDGDQQTVRSITMRVIRRLKSTHPDIVSQLSEALSFHAIGASAKRSAGISELPVDAESRNALAVLEEIPDVQKPVLDADVSTTVDAFIKERLHAEKLIAHGLTPPSSVLLYGPPGVGKTMLAKYLAQSLNVKFVYLELATAVSSYLGKTGQNLKQVTDYAKREPCLLLLDEFDAIAKKRDDVTEIGELKRIVNVLLKELEDWPSHSVLIAATNHPELLDRAIWRRFDHAIEIGLPNLQSRAALLEQEQSGLSTEIIQIAAELTEGFSGSDISKLCKQVSRKAILDSLDYTDTFIHTLTKFNNADSVEFNKKFCKLARDHTGISIGTLASLLGKSRSTIQYYLRAKGDE